MIFQEMKNSFNKEAFITKKTEVLRNDPQRLSEMKEYIFSADFDHDLDRLISKDYYLNLPRMIMLRKADSNRRRKVFCFDDRDRTLLQYINFMVMIKYDDRYNDGLYSFRKSHNINNLVNSIIRNDRDRSRYVIKADIHSYGESINTDILDGILKEWMADEQELYEFIMWLVTRNEYYRDGKIEKGFTSVMSGNPLTNFLENIYLCEMDYILAEKSLVYSRYTDDICLICKDKGTADENYRLLREIVEQKLDLSFNEAKTGFIEPGIAYDLLGYKFGANLIDISENTFRKIASRLKHRANRLSRGVSKGYFDREEALKRMARFIERQFYGRQEDGNRYSFARKTMAIINTTERLKLLDEISEDCLRFVGSGKKTNAKFRIRYNDLEKLGYKPLVHEYYHRFEPDGMFRKGESEE